MISIHTLFEVDNSNITFPKVEWKDVQARLDRGETITTTRNSCGIKKKVFKVGEVYTTEWGSAVEILKVKKFADPTKIPTYNKMDNTMKASISHGIKMCGTSNLQWVHLKSLSHPNNGVIFHLVMGRDRINSIKKYGLCSPRRLYEVDKKIFDNKPFRIYKQRASSELNIPIDEVTREDVLTYLDTSSQRLPYFTSKSLFGNWLPYEEMGDKVHTLMKGPLYELTIPISVVKKHKPIVVGPGKVERYSTWNEVQSKRFLDMVRKQTKTPITSKYRFTFDHVAHWAFTDVYYIPYNKIQSVRIIL